jgi:hypothetical protein
MLANKQSQKSTRSAKDHVEEDKQEGEEEEEEEEKRYMDMGIGVGVDMDVDMDKLAKGGWQGKKGKKGGKAGKGKRAEEKQAEEKKYVFILVIFFMNLIGFAKLPLEKNGPSPKSKGKKIWYILIQSINILNYTEPEKQLCRKMLMSRPLREVQSQLGMFKSLIYFFSY